MELPVVSGRHRQERSLTEFVDVFRHREADADEQHAGEDHHRRHDDHGAAHSSILRRHGVVARMSTPSHGRVDGAPSDAADSDVRQLATTAAEAHVSGGGGRAVDGRCAGRRRHPEPRRSVVRVVRYDLDAVVVRQRRHCSPRAHPNTLENVSQ